MLGDTLQLVGGLVALAGFLWGVGWWIVTRIVVPALVGTVEKQLASKIDAIDALQRGQERVVGTLQGYAQTMSRHEARLDAQDAKLANLLGVKPAVERVESALLDLVDTVRVMSQQIGQVQGTTQALLERDR